MTASGLLLPEKTRFTARASHGSQKTMFSRPHFSPASETASPAPFARRSEVGADLAREKYAMRLAPASIRWRASMYPAFVLSIPTRSCRVRSGGET